MEQRGRGVQLSGVAGGIWGSHGQIDGHVPGIPQQVRGEMGSQSQAG